MTRSRNQLYIPIRPLPDRSKIAPRRDLAGPTPHAFCTRCERAISLRGWLKHVRICSGITWCPICKGPFPCLRTWCPWGAAYEPPPPMPEVFVPYFRRMRKQALGLELPDEVFRWLLEQRLRARRRGVCS